MLAMGLRLAGPPQLRRQVLQHLRWAMRCVSSLIAIERNKGLSGGRSSAHRSLPLPPGRIYAVLA